MAGEIRILRLAGRCSNGAEADGGRLWHATRGGAGHRERALCGAKPGRRSVGWSEWHGTTATCPRCIAKLRRLAIGGVMERALGAEPSPLTLAARAALPAEAPRG